MYQKVLIIGNLGRDPEMRYLPDGTPVTTMSVATNEKWNDRSGQRQERTTWWRVSVYGRMAETVNQYLTKGQRVLVEGTMVIDPQSGGPRIWTDQGGNTRASFELRAKEIKFLAAREGGQGSGAPHHDQGYTDFDDAMMPSSEDDIPF